MESEGRLGTNVGELTREERDERKTTPGRGLDVETGREITPGRDATRRGGGTAPGRDLTRDVETAKEITPGRTEREPLRPGRNK